MSEIVDMHCHVLPGLDDGPATMEESMAVLREAQRQGIGTMIATPHFHPGRYKVSARSALDALERVRSEAAREGLKLRLLPGQECYYYTELLGELQSGNALTMAGTDRVLVEFDPDAIYAMMTYAVRQRTEAGYRPIIAHIERYECLYDRPDRLEELRGGGAALQLNFDRLLERDGLFRRNPWRRLMKEGRVDYLGSDTHGMDFRPLRVDRAVAWLRSEVEGDVVRRVLEENTRCLLGR